MKKWLTTLLVLIVLVSIVGWQKTKEHQVKETAINFIEGINERNAEKASNYFILGLQESVKENYQKQFKNSDYKDKYVTVANLKVEKMDGSYATISGEFITKDKKENTSTKEKWSMLLMKEDGKWKIDTIGN